MKSYIDRQEILKIADKLTQVDMVEAFQMINDLPTEQLEPQKWRNPNTESPQLHDTVLVTVDTGDFGPEVAYATYIPGAHVYIGNQHVWVPSEKHWYIIDWEEWTDYVTAWMPLPEPYGRD